MPSAPQVLRDYQLDLLSALQLGVEEWLPDKERYARPVIIAGTGSGKTTVFCEMVKQRINPETGRALLIGHTEEIMFQMHERLQQQTQWKPFMVANNRSCQSVGMVGAGFHDVSARAICALFQSLSAVNLAAILSHGDIDLVIIDECDLGVAASYRRIVDTLQTMCPNVRIIGVSATTERSDKKPLLLTFDKIVKTWGLLQGIQTGNLVPPTVLEINTKVNISGVKTNTNGDYDEDMLADVLDVQNWTEKIYEAYMKELHGSRFHTLAFMPSVTMSKMLVNAFREQGIVAYHLDGNTPKDDRRRIVADFNAGKVRVLSNYNVLTRGTDTQRCDSILDGRPTRSNTLRTQMYGRGLRLFVGKHDCLILKFIAEGQLDLTIEPTLEGKMIKCANDACKAKFMKGLLRCPKCGAEPPKPEPRQASGEGFAITLPTLEGDEAEGVEGGELLVRTVTLLDSLAAMWYHDENDVYTVGLMDNGSFLILPPVSITDDEVNALRTRRRKGEEFMGSADVDQQDLLAKLNTLQRQLTRTQGYTLFHVTKATYKEDEDTGRRVIDKPATVNQLSTNDDLTSLLIYADGEAKKLGGVRKNDRWVKSTAGVSEQQAKLLRNLGVPAEQVAKLGKTDASKLITHIIALNAVNKHLNRDVYQPKPQLEIA